MELRGKKVLVTGASRGLGRAMVEALRERGAAEVFAGARRPEDLEALAAAGVRPVRLDVTDDADRRRVVEAVGALDLLVNNAGTLEGHGLLTATKEAVEHDFAVNFWAPLEMTKAALPGLVERQGAVLNVLTLLSMASMPAIGGYAASKAAAWSMTQALRAELKPRGVSVHAIYPGAVDTDMIRGFEMPKTPAADVAAAALDALERDVLDAFPDPMSKQAGEAWLRDPRSLEAMFASMGGA